MKVVLFARNLCLGGVERCVAVLAGELAKQGHEVRLVLLGSSENLWPEELAGVEVCDISSLWRGLRWWSWFSEARRMVKGADVVIAANFLMPLYMAWLVTRPSEQRLVGWVHSPFMDVQAVHMNPVHRIGSQWIFRRLPDVVCVSRYARESLGEWIGMPPRPSWAVIPNFSGSGGFRPLATPGATLRLLYVGRLAAEKRPLLLLDILGELRQRGIPAHLTVVGDGPLRQAMEQALQRKGLQGCVDFAGFQSEVGPYYEAADVLLLTSIFEGLSIVVIEAMQAGLPVLSTDSGGPRELLEPMDGLMISADPAASVMADKLMAIISHHEEISSWMRKRSSEFTREKFVARWLNVLFS